MTASISLTKEDLNTIASLANERFASLENVAQPQRFDSKFYRVTPPSGINCFIKVFVNRRLYEIELFALHLLRNNERFCPILCSSENFELRKESQTPSLYFIVKPAFNKFLDVKEKKTILLDNAAQMIDIARELRKEGLYDWDENWENNAFDDNGRLVRIDLDAFYNYKNPIPKFNHHFHSPRAVELKRSLSRACEEFDELPFINTGLAVRLSRFLLDRAGKFSELEIWLPSSNEPNPPGTLSKAAGWLGNLFSSSNETILPLESASDSGDEDKLRSWDKIWRDKFSGASEIPYKSLSVAEAVFFGRIVRRMLTKPDFTLDDSYYSILLLLAGSLQRQTKSSQDIIRFPKGLFDEVFEIKKLGEIIPDALAADDSPTSQLPDSAETLVIEDIKSDGGFWASLKKETTHKTQDRVRIFSDAPYPFIILADGVSNANGEEAAEITVRVSGEVSEEMKRNPGRFAAGEWIVELVKRINTSLIENQKREKFQTTFTIALIEENKSGAPFIHLAQYGDSPWLVIEEGEKKEKVVHKNSLRCDDKKLGVKAVLSDEWIDGAIMGIRTVPGKYYIRLFSDGITNPVRDKLEVTDPIKGLVSEVEGWSKKYPADIGHDDWSIVGFDIEVKKYKPGKSKKGGNTESEMKKATMPQPVIEFKLEPSKFRLSPVAREFWKQTLSEGVCRDLNNLAIIKQTLNLNLPVQPAASQQNDPADETKSNQWGLLPKILIGFGVLALSISFFVVWVMLLKYYYSNTPSTNISNVNAVPGTPEKQNLTFGNKETQDLYKILETDGVVILDSLPGGADINADVFQKTLSRLADIMRATDWIISIEVHTDAAGEEAGNQKISEERGKRIRQRLIDLQVKESQIKIRSLGESKPFSLADSPKNRRIVIQRGSN